MKYVLYLLLVAVIFGLVALVDRLIQKLFPKEGTMKSGNTVRMPRYSVILGVLITMLGFIGLLYVPRATEKLLWFGCWVVLVIGAYLLINFYRFAIFYDEDQFVYRTLTKKAKTYRYSEIRGQRTFMARSGYNTTLYVGDDEIQLYGVMQGLDSFLNKAFFRWCAQNGTDPDKVENNPAMLVFFPEPEGQTETIL